MSRIGNGLLSRGLTLARALTTRRPFNPRTAFIHPEKRRTFPIVYYSWKDIPHTLEKMQEAEVVPKIEVYSEDKPSTRKDGLWHVFYNRGNSFHSDMHRWSEFRRKIIYGVY